MALILIDTDILIDAANGETVAANWLHQTSQSTTLAISVITQMGIVVGCRNKVELRNTENFLRAFQVRNMTPEICDRAVALLRQYRLSHGLYMPDALIAATAIEHGEQFTTKNQRDYRFISPA